MKIRNGFVSNSSSSSFIVAVPNKETVCKCCNRSNKWVIQAITKYLTVLTKERNELQNISNTKWVEEYFKKDLEDLIASKKHCEEQLEVISELEQDLKLLENFKRLTRQLDYMRHRNLKTEHEISGGERSTRDDLDERKARVKRYLADYDKKLERLKEIIKQIEEYIAKDYSIYVFTVDNWANDVEQCLQQMMAAGEIVVINKEVS